MSDCQHPLERLFAKAAPYTLSDPEGGLLARLLTVTVHCQDCGKPFRFEGAFAPVPNTITELENTNAAWLSQDGSELGIRISPNETGATWATANPAGRG